MEYIFLLIACVGSMKLCFLSNSHTSEFKIMND